MQTGKRGRGELSPVSLSQHVQTVLMVPESGFSQQPIIYCQPHALLSPLPAPNLPSTPVQLWGNQDRDGATNAFQQRAEGMAEISCLTPFPDH